MDKGFQILEQIIQTTTLRHKLLASNIANVDTPGYKAKDLPFNTVLKDQVMGLSRTDANHLAGSPVQAGVGDVKDEERAPWEDGNNVSLDTELSRMTENALLYEAGTTLLSKKIQMYKNALKR
ncbi:MAG TPA: flagellar basal body rod protein FlgB [Thermodesulfobacteriota bacterium]|nr:flagellar basal body rod protein FlgB [Thermodesulfobacteriota bacterium]